MCWFTRKKLNKLVANENVFVYKFIGKNAKDYYSPYRGTQIILGDTLECDNGFDHEKCNPFKTIGLHSYTSDVIVQKISNYGIDIYSPHDYFNNLDCWLTWFDDYEMYLAKCYIPKGSTYFVNENYEVVSDKLVVTDNMISVEDILKSLTIDEMCNISDFFGNMKEKIVKPNIIPVYNLINAFPEDEKVTEFF